MRKPWMAAKNVVAIKLRRYAGIGRLFRMANYLDYRGHQGPARSSSADWPSASRLQIL
jgi:hypothetical protein